MRKIKEENGSAITVVIVLMVIVLLVMAAAIVGLIYLIKTGGMEDKKNEEVAINIVSSTPVANETNVENTENVESNTQAGSTIQISPLIGTTKVITEQEFVSNLKGIEKYSVVSQIENGVTSNVYEYTGIYLQDEKLFGATITLKQVNNKNEITVKFNSEEDKVNDLYIVGLNAVMTGTKTFTERYKFDDQPTYTGVIYNSGKYIIIDSMNNGIGTIMVREALDSEFQTAKLVMQ